MAARMMMIATARILLVWCLVAADFGSSRRTGVQAQFIDQVACLECISQDGCQYCIADNGNNNYGGGGDSSTSSASSAAPLYCECNVVEGMPCLSTEEQCEVDIAQMVRAVGMLLLLPLLCGCICLAGCVFLCCRTNHKGSSNNNLSSGGNYYMQEGSAYTPANNQTNNMHHAVVGTEPYGVENQQKPQSSNNYYNNDRPFSQALNAGP
jgi:hypothetical protein